LTGATPTEKDVVIKLSFPYLQQVAQWGKEPECPTPGEPICSAAWKKRRFLFAPKSKGKISEQTQQKEEKKEQKKNWGDDRSELSLQDHDVA
jgi:hypothetical protein